MWYMLSSKLSSKYLSLCLGCKVQQHISHLKIDGPTYPHITRHVESLPMGLAPHACRVLATFFSLGPIHMLSMQWIDMIF